MKVTIEHKPHKYRTRLTGGWDPVWMQLAAAPVQALLKQKHTAQVIYVTLEFSEEEKFAIEKSGLANYVFYEIPSHALGNYEDIPGFPKSRACKPAIFLKNKTIALAACPDTYTADQEEKAIRDALKNLKNSIETHKQPPKEKDSFEL